MISNRVFRRNTSQGLLLLSGKAEGVMRIHEIP
jgi:hypothetical protein